MRCSLSTAVKCACAQAVGSALHVRDPFPGSASGPQLRASHLLFAPPRPCPRPSSSPRPSWVPRPGPAADAAVYRRCKRLSPRSRRPALAFCSQAPVLTSPEAHGPRRPPPSCPTERRPCLTSPATLLTPLGSDHGLQRCQCPLVPPRMLEGIPSCPSPPPVSPATALLLLAPTSTSDAQDDTGIY